jgi:hypothetical protein
MRRRGDILARAVTNDDNPLLSRRGRFWNVEGMKSHRFISAAIILGSALALAACDEKPAEKPDEKAAADKKDEMKTDEAKADEAKADEAKADEAEDKPAKAEAEGEEKEDAKEDAKD